MSDRPGAARLEPDPWLTGLFAYPVFRLQEPAEVRPDLHRQLPAGDAFVFARVPVSEVATVGRLDAAGFRVVDVTLRFTAVPWSRPPREGEPLVRDARPADYDRVLAIAESAFRYSRFHLDPLVPRSIADAVKRAWMDSYRAGRRGQGCLVAVDALPDGSERVIGFLGVVEVKREGVVRVIDLIAVDEAAQGRGAGRALVNAFAGTSVGVARELEVGTQAANVPSVRLYESCGFRLAGAAYVMHAHYRDGAPRQ